MPLHSKPTLQKLGKPQPKARVWDLQLNSRNITTPKTMTPELKERIENLINQNKIMVFMKGTKLMPMCGFSNNVVQMLNTLGVPFETLNILDDSDIRQGIKEYSNWPTIPQVYINGEFVGGSDILIELYQKGELQQIVEVAMAS
jgi:monothiol glutaredoxin